jgi:N-hydroxyarylamine O-acetyltransferase
VGDPVFDLDRYLERIGLSSAPSPDLDGLEAVQAAQLRAVPFENLDVLLTGQIDVEPDAIFDKLVRRGRGGYCFECNLLLREALLALGFEARTLLARVVIDRVDGPVPARTHAIVEVQIGDRHYAADCGFGAQTPRGVLQLPDGTTRDGDAAWRLQDDPQFGVRLLKEDPDRPPHDLYVFDFIEVHPADIAVGNHWTSTHPSSHFTQKIVAVRQNDGGRVAIVF